MGAGEAAEYKQIRYERPAAHVARIVLNRPETRNAQTMLMTYELDDALRAACLDDDVTVIILAAEGDHFSSGHDISLTERLYPTKQEVRGLWGQFDGPGWEGLYARERELYFDVTERWRNAPKPVIAAVQGSVVAGANPLIWACDIIIAAEDATFRDNSCGEMGVPGVEYFMHPFELGVRKAKEWMFTASWLSAADAEKRGMVNQVVAREALESAALAMAAKIAQHDRFTLKLMKESINAAQDAMGRREALSLSFAMHQIGHLQNMVRYGFPVDTKGLRPSVRGKVEAAAPGFNKKQE